MISKSPPVLLPPTLPVKRYDIANNELPLDCLAAKYFRGEIGETDYTAELRRRARSAVAADVASTRMTGHARIVHAALLSSCERARSVFRL